MSCPVTLYLSHAISLQSPQGYPYPSLPLNRPWRLRRHIIDHAIDAFDLIGDACCGAAEEGHFKPRLEHNALEAKFALLISNGEFQRLEHRTDDRQARSNYSVALPIGIGYFYE